MLKIGDFVTSYSAGYWQVVDIKPKLVARDSLPPQDPAAEKPGTVVGKWIILKKAFTPKMKPRVSFECCDAFWVKPVEPDVLAAIRQAFADDPKYKAKFENAPLKLPLDIVNCWVSLSEEEAISFRAAMATLPARYTMEEFWAHMAAYRDCLTRPGKGDRYLLNFFMHPWDLTADFAYIYTGCDLQKL